MSQAAAHKRPHEPGGGEAPAIVIMARVPRRGEVRRALEEELGPARCLALHATLILEAVRWARSLSPRELHVAYEPADGAAELRRLVGDDVHLFPQNGEGITGRLGDAVIRVAARGAGPILVIWPDLPQFRRSHAEAVLHDLAHGADLVVGPVFDGGFYLLGMPRQLPQLFSIPEATIRTSEGLSAMLGMAIQERLQIGMLPAERALHRPADLRAILADPLFEGPVAKALGRA